MPKSIFIPHDGSVSRARSGIRISWVPSTRRLDIDGWYDSIVGIEGESFTLREFFAELGITKAQCLAAYKVNENEVAG